LLFDNSARPFIRVKSIFLMLDFANRRVLVLGLGDTGLSMTRWLERRGAEVSVVDTRANPPHAATLARELPRVDVTTGPFLETKFAKAEMIAISPGIDRRAPLVADAIKRGVPVVGDVELFACAIDALPPARVLAITGSNGKSTVTVMTGDMCRAAGVRTVVAGNIGLPVLDALASIEEGGRMPQVFVLELSSFQLESTESLKPDAATVLNLTEDHMDRYAGLADYAAAKARIFAGRGAQVLNRDDQWSLGMARPGRAVSTFGLAAPGGNTEWGVRDTRGRRWLAHGGRELLPLDEIPVAGLHNAANALAALALCHWLGLPEEPQLEALRRFESLPHRVQKVGERGGVTFYDDSKGTNVGATVAALRGMGQPTVLIAGGDGKHQDFSPLAGAVAENARAVVVIGRDGALIAHALAGCRVPLMSAGTMEEAVDAAFHASRPGDAVLLSPACASYDMFRNYVHRAEIFIEAVKQLMDRKK
jgi:UDP-N-acetylmuramoylalanine--D-glutamate ligase